MKLKPWIPPPCKSSNVSSESRSSKVRRKQLSHHRRRSNSVKIAGGDGWYVETFRHRPTDTSDYFEVLRNLSTFKSLFYDAQDEIKELRAKLDEKSSEIAKLEADFHSEQAGRQTAEDNCKLLAKLVEKYEALNVVQQERIANYENETFETKKIEKMSEIILHNVGTMTDINVEENISTEKLVSSQHTQISPTSTRKKSSQTVNFVDVNEKFVQTDFLDEKLKETHHREVQTDEEFLRIFVKNERNVKLLKEKLKKYKEKFSNLVQPAVVSGSSSSSDGEELQNLTRSFYKLQRENKNLKEYISFLIDSYRILFVDET